MKTIKSLIVAALLGLFITNTANALNPAETFAQTAFRQYLTSIGIANDIDKKDNSVNFLQRENRDDVLYWVTFESVGNANILYTLHRRPIKMESTESTAEKNARRIEIASLAVNYMNANNPFKAYVNGNKVEFVYPILASSPDDYAKVFKKALESMKNAKKSYDACHERAKIKTDSIHNYWTENNPNTIVVKQNGSAATQQSNNLTISSVEFRNVNDKNTVISDYGQSIRKSELQFIQPQVTIKATSKGVYHIGVVIITPDGKTLVPSNDTKRTILTTTEVDKKDKAIDLGIFGAKGGKLSNDKDLWQAGEYQVIFYENDREIKRTSFNVL